MKPSAAAKALMDAMREDTDLRDAVMAICKRHGVTGVLDLAEQHPDEVVEIAESWLGTVEQTPPGLRPL